MARPSRKPKDHFGNSERALPAPDLREALGTELAVAMLKEEEKLPPALARPTEPPLGPLSPPQKEELRHEGRKRARVSFCEWSAEKPTFGATGF
ncbi:hypothetical protein KM043_011128 [Ampulex compressa]|nr:hypothetical protein KM043_011128 [Ampulex compressa]